MSLQKRLLILSGLIALIFAGGTLGFYFLGNLAGGRPGLLDSLYQTTITLTTLGSREMKPLTELWYGKVFVIVLLFAGMGVLFVFATSLTAFLVEGELRHIFWRRKMDKLLEKLENHIIVCGAGATGTFVIEELLGSGHEVVIVDAQQERIERILEAHADKRIPYVLGNAADDEVLERAGVVRARGIVVALPDERDNLFVTVTARQRNPRLRIITRSSDAQDEARLTRAGADVVINPSRIGGLRMASEMVRPQVVTFLDQMLRGQEQTLRIEELPLTAGCSMVGQALRDTNLRREAKLLVLAIRDASGQRTIYNPPPEQVLETGDTLIVLGPVDSVRRLRQKMR